MLQGDWSRVIHRDDIEQVRAAWQRAIADGDQFRCDCRLRRRDGAWRVFDNHALPQKDDNGVILGWVGSSTDSTEQHAAQRADRKAQEVGAKAGDQAHGAGLFREEQRAEN